ncbi:hypothetical protein NMP99_02855 [Glutamicibacter mishrai]|uniref:hypothetical protein n=1 Tax=Glutamicibacter mishrai TaxID=1775880 RepID=UPI0020CBB284|nr:hypothetical protein [Glutamicibacter mishrai]UTT40267.1 hypothetical protein NMP99_02855 [Glutamicibacter mishrai]
MASYRPHNPRGHRRSVCHGPIDLQCCHPGSPEAATGAAALALGIAAAITRIMALPGVEAFFQRFLPWLAAGTKDDEPPATGIEVTGPVTLDE